MKDSIKVAIAGCTGYIGLQLIKLLQKHPKVKILYLCATKSIGKSINQFDNKITKNSLNRTLLTAWAKAVAIEFR